MMLIYLLRLLDIAIDERESVIVEFLFNVIVLGIIALLAFISLAFYFLGFFLSYKYKEKITSKYPKLE